MIVVTAATGSIGQQVVENLVDAGREVRVIVRSASRLDDRLRDSIEVVEGSHSDRAVLDQALTGASALFWLVPPDPTADSVYNAYLEFSRPAVEVMQEGKVGRVVGVSALGRGTQWAQNAGYVTATLAVDDLIAAAGVHYRALTMPSFMDNIGRQAKLIKDQGIFTSPISGDKKMPTCATRDIAAVAARLLTDDGWTGVEEVPVLGPEDLSFHDMAHIISDVLGSDVAFRQVPPEAFLDRMTGMGMSQAMAQGMLDMALAKNDGLDNGVARTTQNSTPTTFRDWCETELKPAVT